LSDLKDSHPIEVAEYAVAYKIVEQPTFGWWAKQALKKHDCHIKKAKSCSWKQTHKFGVELPKSVAMAYAIDCSNSSKLCTNAIAKEMLNVRPVFKFVDDNVIPAFWKPVGVHMIFDVKMDLTWKARLVANSHETEVPTESTYSTVVTRDSVRLAFLLAALKDISMLTQRRTYTSKRLGLNLVQVSLGNHV
jgi:hypothetical protein